MWRGRKRNGKEVVLLNPSEKGAKYAKEMRSGVKTTNDGRIKRDKAGNAIGLNRTEKSYRAGYLDARKDSANAYKARSKKKKVSKTSAPPEKRSSAKTWTQADADRLGQDLIEAWEEASLRPPY